MIVSRVPFWFTFHEDSIGGSKSDARSSLVTFVVKKS